MGLLSFKSVGVILVILTVLGFATGYVSLNRDTERCFRAKHWTFGDYRTYFAVGGLEFRYRIVNYDCDPSDKADLKKFKPLEQTTL